MRPTGPAQHGELLLDIVGILSELAIPYAVIGALATSFYGIPPSTTDGETMVWMKGTGKTERDLTDRLAEAGYRATFKQGDLDDPILGSIIVEDEHGNRVDLLLGIRGMDPDAAGRCVSARLLDSSISMIAAEDLIPMKISAGGFPDITDVRGILQVSGELLNLELLRQLAARYGAAVTRKLNELLNEYPPTGT